MFQFGESTFQRDMYVSNSCSSSRCAQFKVHRWALGDIVFISKCCISYFPTCMCLSPPSMYAAFSFLLFYCMYVLYICQFVLLCHKMSFALTTRFSRYLLHVVRDCTVVVVLCDSPPFFRLKISNIYVRIVISQQLSIFFLFRKL